MKQGRQSKRIQILQTAKHLFFKHGFRRVPVEEICRHADVSKMTFYKYFRNKTDVIIQLLHWIFEDAMAQYESIMSQNIHYQVKIQLLIQMKLKTAKNITPEFLRDLFRNPEEEVSRAYHEIVDQSIRKTISDLVQAQREGHIRKDVKPEFLVYFLNHMPVMMDDKNLIGLYGSSEELISELTHFFFYGVLSRPEIR